MNQKNLGGGNWHEFDFRIAGDSEYYKALLRQMIGVPSALPGEKSEVSQQKPNRQRHPHKRSSEGDMSGFLHKS